jgi:hypothetical protein
MIASAAEHVDMQITFRARDKALPEIFDCIGLKSGRRIAARDEGNARKSGLEYEKGSPAEIDGGTGKSLVHRIDEETGAHNAGTVCEGFIESLPERDSRIFHEVMLVNLEIARKGARKVEHSVLAKRGEHVTEKADRASDIALSRPVKIERERNLRLTRNPFDRSDSTHKKFLIRSCRKSKVQFTALRRKR